MDRHNMFLLKLSEHLTTQDTEKLKFVFKIPKGVAENVKTALDLVRTLSERGLVTPEKLDLLKEGMNTIERKDLADMIDEYNGRNNDNVQLNVPRNIPNGIEKNGYQVTFTGGKRYVSDGIVYLEMELNTKFRIKVSNGHENGCKCDVSCDAMHVITKQLNSHQEIALDNSFLFCSSGDKQLQNLPLQWHVTQSLQITATPEAFTIYFNMRTVDEKHVVNFTLVKNVCIVKKSDVKIQEVLDRVQKEHKIFGACFLYGGKILSTDEILRSALDNHSDKFPFLLLLKNEKVVVNFPKKQSKHVVEVNPLECRENSGPIQRKISSLPDFDHTCEVTVDQESITTNWMKCFDKHHVEVTKKDASRDRAVRESSTVRSAGRPTYHFDDDEDDLLKLVEEGYKPLNSKCDEEKQVSKPVREEKAVVQRESEMIISPADKVIITVYVVPPNSPPLL